MTVIGLHTVQPGTPAPQCPPGQEAGRPAPSGSSWWDRTLAHSLHEDGARQEPSGWPPGQAFAAASWSWPSWQQPAAGLQTTWAPRFPIAQPGRWPAVCGSYPSGQVQSAYPTAAQPSHVRISMGTSSGGRWQRCWAVPPRACSRPRTQAVTAPHPEQRIHGQPRFAQWARNRRDLQAAQWSGRVTGRSAATDQPPRISWSAMSRSSSASGPARSTRVTGTGPGWKWTTGVTVPRSHSRRAPSRSRTGTGWAAMAIGVRTRRGPAGRRRTR